MDRIRRKSIVFILVCLLISTSCFATEIGVVLDNKNIEFDVQPILQNDRVLVPMRKIFEELGCSVEWLGDSQTVIATQNSKIIALRVGVNKIICSNIETGTTEMKRIDVAPILQNGRTLVPVRFISETLNYFVDWEAKTNTVIINTK